MRGVRRGVVVAAAVVGTILTAAGPAGANVGVSLSMTMPAGVAVGQQANGSVTVINSNTPPNQAESNTVTQLRLAPSCNSTPSAANPCPAPEPGVFAITAATGAAGTACAGRTFAVSAPDAAGIVTFTTAPPVVLAPPGGAAGSDRCTVNFTFRVLKMPAVDANPAAVGVQTRANFLGQLTGQTSGLVVTSSVSAEMVVSRATATITTQVSSSSVNVGRAVTDTAVVTGVSGVLAPTGTVAFQLYGPNDTNCTRAPFGQSTASLSPTGATTSAATSAPFVLSQSGAYRFVVIYGGDANYLPVTSVCNSPNETVVASSPPRRTADFDGNGTTDVAVFRPAEGNWYVQTPAPMLVQWGQAGDVPVAGDYDGNGTTDMAVFRPANGGWYIRTPSPMFVAWGQNGDIPVPADYDGNGITDVAVFRPASGTWYVRTPSPFAVVWGQLGDIPVPADYDGNGVADIAVFRPDSGAWYLRTATPTFVVWGQAGDIPVPGNYDGNTTTDVAVFRPGNGTWYLRTATPGAVQWGQVGDVPVPGDYDGNGTTDVAVFRPSNNTWYLRTTAPTARSWGGAGDRPVPLPSAIYERYFGGAASDR